MIRQPDLKKGIFEGRLPLPSPCNYLRWKSGTDRHHKNRDSIPVFFIEGGKQIADTSVNHKVIDVNRLLGKHLMMFRFGQDGKVRKWLVGLLLCVLIVPASGLYAMPNKQSADNGLPPCHQVQDQEQTATQGKSSKSCCDSLHQCDGNCDHDCSDCFSTGHLFGLIPLPAEPQQSASSHSIPISSYHNGLKSTNLLRPPRQFI
jgi:hypothetical protein